MSRQDEITRRDNAFVEMMGAQDAVEAVQAFTGGRKPVKKSDVSDLEKADALCLECMYALAAGNEDEKADAIIALMILSLANHTLSSWVVDAWCRGFITEVKDYA